MSFLDDYEPVEVRLAKFWADHPDGRVVTELVSFDGEQWVFKASVFAGDVLRATGFAHEVTTQRGVNSTSAAENCETSAIGRALANFNYAAKGKRPSREEMAKTRPRQVEAPAGPAPTVGAKASSDHDSASRVDDVPAGVPLVGESTLNLLKSRVSALIADKVEVSEARKARRLPLLKEPLSVEAADGWKKLLDELERGLEAPFV